MPIVGPAGLDRFESVDESQLSPDQRKLLDLRKKEFDKLVNAPPKAKYKIEVMFVGKRSVWKPTMGALTIWESGTMLNGEGDTGVYFCPGKKLGRSECTALIPDVAHDCEVAFCSACGQTWKGNQLDHVLQLGLPMRQWAEVIVRHMSYVKHDADIYLKYSYDDIRTTTIDDFERRKHGDILNPMRGRRGKAIYPVANIIKDTANGANLTDRIYAFLVA